MRCHLLNSTDFLVMLAKILPKLLRKKTKKKKKALPCLSEVQRHLLVQNVLLKLCIVLLASWSVCSSMELHIQFDHLQFTALKERASLHTDPLWSVSPMHALRCAMCELEQRGLSPFWCWGKWRISLWCLTATIWLIFEEENIIILTSVFLPLKAFF